MKKVILLVLSIAMIFALAACNTSEEQSSDDSKITVAVSIVPASTFVEAVAGDLVDVIVVVPPGNSPANYEPTTTEMQALSDADLYFVMQVPTETANILPKIYDFNEDITLINLRDAVSEQYPLRYMGTDSSTVDPHIWLSPKRAIVMVQTIADELSKLDEENADLYQANAEAYIEELNATDEEIKEIIAGIDNKSFMLYHAAYGYFADDYGLEMISIESDGKAATAGGIEEAVEQAIEQGITTIFYQDEFDDTQAQTVAEEIGGTVTKTAPLTADYIQGLKNFANALAGN